MQERIIAFSRGGINIVIKVTPALDVLLLHAGMKDFDPQLVLKREERFFRIVEVQIAGGNQNDHHGNKHTGCYPGYALKYIDHTLDEGETYTLFTLHLSGGGVMVTYEMRLMADTPCIQAQTAVQAVGDEAVTLEYVSSFALTGFGKEETQPERSCYVSIPHNSWCTEMQWHRSSLEDMGLGFPVAPKKLHNQDNYHNFSMKPLQIFGQGTWPTSEYLPMGIWEASESQQAMVWQIETSSPWQWEISTIAGHYYLQLSGPDDNRHNFFKKLKPGETFQSIPCSLAFGEDWQSAYGALTSCRRAMVLQGPDRENAPVIYNDVMATDGDPSHENLAKLMPYAKAAGCDVFCIDTGWYAKEDWWNTVGMWHPEPEKFPRGMKAVMDDIRQMGMEPGMWLEPEVLGLACPEAKTWPEECFFQRHGKRVIDHNRYQLDVRHPIVREFMDEVMDRMMDEYGMEYLKLDYNINGGYGTQEPGKSPGETLLEYNRALSAWLKDVLVRHPNLTIENCASGGMRMEYNILSITHLQSLTDQGETDQLARIASAAPTAVLPEQAGVWVLPAPGQTLEETGCAMVNGMLLRIHLSGSLDKLEPEQMAAVVEGIALYKTYRKRIRTAMPYWPLGLVQPKDEQLSLMLMFPEGDGMVAVWNLSKDEKTVTLPMPQMVQKAKITYPSWDTQSLETRASGKEITIILPPGPSARIIHVK